MDERYSATERLEDAVGNLPGGERVNQFARATAKQIGKAADYVRTHDANRMMSDVEKAVTDNPGPSLLIAAAFGFVVGRMMTRD